MLLHVSIIDLHSFVVSVNRDIGKYEMLRVRAKINSQIFNVQALAQ
jgi:hypothetical protein